MGWVASLLVGFGLAALLSVFDVKFPRVSFKRRPPRGQRQYEVRREGWPDQTVWANDAADAVERVNRFQTRATVRVVGTGEYVFLTRKHISDRWTL